MFVVKQYRSSYLDPPSRRSLNGQDPTPSPEAKRKAHQCSTLFMVRVCDRVSYLYVSTNVLLRAPAYTPAGLVAQ